MTEPLYDKHSTAVATLIEFVDRHIMPYQPIGDAAGEWKQAKEALRVLKATPLPECGTLPTDDEINDVCRRVFACANPTGVLREWARTRFTPAPVSTSGVLPDYQEAAENAIAVHAYAYDEITQALLVVDVRKAIERAVRDALSASGASK